MEVKIVVNENELKALFVKNGLNQAQVADRLGICSKTLGAKIKKGVFNSDEIYKLMNILNIENPVPIFFS